MELDKDEQGIMAYFPTTDKAQKAMDELSKAGLVPGEGYMQIDRISRYAVVNDRKRNNPTNNASTLHGLTNYSNSEGLNQGLNPLLAANDSESGRGVYDDNFSGKSVMLTLVTKKENVDKAVKIMKDNGGLT
ncbi:MAG: hypothetical protein ABFD04_09880 [Syntrophomonas sp.]